MRKKITKKQSKPKAEAAFDQPKEYININEGQEELSEKTKKLWIIVVIFSIFLVAIWLLILRITIAEQTKKINFGELSNEISQSLAKFDTEIKNRTSDVSDLNVDDIEAIKKQIEEQIKNNPDSSAWTTYQIINSQSSIKYPENWRKLKESNQSITLIDWQSTSTPEAYGQIEITIKDNRQNYDLADWLVKNKIKLTDYREESSTFKFASSSAISIFSSVNSAASELDRIYFLKPTADKNIYEIKAQAQGDLNYYSPLINEIINTIK